MEEYIVTDEIIPPNLPFWEAECIRSSAAFQGAFRSRRWSHSFKLMVPSYLTAEHSVVQRAFDDIIDNYFYRLHGYDSMWILESYFPQSNLSQVHIRFSGILGRVDELNPRVSIVEIQKAWLLALGTRAEYFDDNIAVSITPLDVDGDTALSRVTKGFADEFATARLRSLWQYTTNTDDDSYDPYIVFCGMNEAFFGTVFSFSDGVLLRMIFINDFDFNCQCRIPARLRIGHDPVHQGLFPRPRRRQDQVAALTDLLTDVALGLSYGLRHQLFAPFTLSLGATIFKEGARAASGEPIKGSAVATILVCYKIYKGIVDQSKPVEGPTAFEELPPS
jgi:hypothetical protein